MPLNHQAAVLFDITVKSHFRTMTSEQLATLNSNQEAKAACLQEILSSFTTLIREQQQQLTDVYKRLENIESDKLAYERKAEIENSVEFLLVSADTQLLQLHFDSLLLQKLHVTALVNEHSVFSTNPLLPVQARKKAEDSDCAEQWTPSVR